PHSHPHAHTHTHTTLELFSWKDGDYAWDGTQTFSHNPPWLLEDLESIPFPSRLWSCRGDGTPKCHRVPVRLFSVHPGISLSLFLSLSPPLHLSLSLSLSLSLF